MTEDVLTEVAGGVATVTFNRPSVRNAISTEMVQRLTEFFGEVAADASARCLVFRGAGDHFCGGGDVRNFRTTLDLSPAERLRSYEDRVARSAALFERLEALKIPVVAVARGAVAGGGLTFALAADITLVSETAFFVFAHSRIGLALDTGLSYYLPRTVGVRRAKELTLLGARMDAPTALAWGMATRVLPDADLDAHAATVIAQLASGATTAYGESKQLLARSLDNDVGAQIALEAGAVGRCAATSDFAEGVSAFLDHRPPSFTGR